MGSFEQINRTGIFSVQLVKNLSLGEHSVMRTKAIEQAYDQAIPDCLEVQDSEADLMMNLCQERLSKGGKDARLSEEIRRQKARNHYSKSTADESDVCVRDLEKLMYVKTNRVSKGVDSVLSENF